MDIFCLKMEQMNEADLREEFLAPLLTFLGYRSGTEGNVSRELSLRYPRSFLGTKKPGSDPYLRGRADYVMEVVGHARWVLEAKSPSEIIDVDAIEQARSYALHPEVGAVYFVISNGHEFLLFRTSSPPGSEPFLHISYGQFSTRIEDVRSVLGVESIRRDFSDLVVGRPIGYGLRSIAKVASGFIHYSESNVSQPLLRQLEIAIVDGAVERGEGGALIAYVVTRAPIRDVQEVIARLGLDTSRYVSSSDFISSDPSAPTLFELASRATFYAGEKLLNVSTWEYITLPADVHCNLVSSVEVHLEDGFVRGRISNACRYTGMLDFEMSFSGSVSIRLI